MNSRALAQERERERHKPARGKNKSQGKQMRRSKWSFCRRFSATNYVVCRLINFFRDFLKMTTKTKKLRNIKRKFSVKLEERWGNYDYLINCDSLSTFQVMELPLISLREASWIKFASGKGAFENQLILFQTLNPPPRFISFRAQVHNNVPLITGRSPQCNFNFNSWRC